MNKQNSKILEEFKQSIRLCEWECWQDIEDAICETNENCYIIWIDLWGNTRYDDIFTYVHLLASQEFGKCLLVPKKKFEKFRKYMRKLYRLGGKDIAYQMREELNRLYPDFKF